MVATVLLLVIVILQLAHGLVEYVVYPTNKKDRSACSQINDALLKILGDSQVHTYTSQIRQTTEFWFVQALEAQKAAILQVSGVDAVMENVIVAQNCGENLTDTSAFTDAKSAGSSQASPGLKLPLRYQQDAPQDLDLVSWPPRKRIPLFGMPWYAYDVARGTDTFIYIIDNGINTDNAEFKSMPWPPQPNEWHYAYGVSGSATDDNLAGHGSCVASKAAGWKTGVSKNSHLVVIKSLPTLADVNFAFAAALDDILAKDRRGKAVVVFPATSIQTLAPGSALPRNWQSVRDLIQELLARDVVVVTAAGNNAARSPALDTVPAIWGLDPHFPLIVAGAVTIADGAMAIFSQGGATPAQIAWAPGDSIVCANGPSAPGLAVRSGTSFAAAMVAGLAAYELTGSDPLPSGSVPRLIRSRLLANSRPIAPLTGPKVIWNGQTRTLDAPLNASASASLLRLVPETQNGTLVGGIANATEGRAAVA